MISTIIVIIRTAKFCRRSKNARVIKHNVHLPDINTYIIGVKVV